MNLNIKTLGDFDIFFGEESLLKETKRSYKLYKLLQYFITFRNRKLLPEVIIDNLWKDQESNDPKNMLRTQIFRLRQLIKKFLPKGADDSKYFNITFINGYYCFEVGECAVLDIVEFEELIDRAGQKEDDDIDEAIDLYGQALEIYKGPYLSENSYEVWLVPVRNHYRRLYIKTLLKLIELYKKKDEHNKIIELCEKAIIIEPYEESIHICLMETMLRIGQIKSAMSHYEYISSLLSKETGVKSSPGLREIHRKIQRYYDEQGETDINNIKIKLEEGPAEGALFCDLDYFKFLYNVEKRRSTRDENIGYMSLITLKSDKDVSKTDELSRNTKSMLEVLEKTLRKGDVFTSWNDTQIIVMLANAKKDGLSKIEKRIRDYYQKVTKTYSNDVSIKFLPMSSDNLMP
ncbi:BTAD domain-containing putative transcriptional regulator [Lutispora thermophila]|uniref:Transcriptional regulatory protein, C terminal n=1 Tax=Lutispora thermophila DSM 19022 TaxID=1122184 RepID=A0A1M6C237_9FIRM|nr:BTAD domain-containing putative transcriptional regulator [Lutispora thermophila]SHI55086.1 Transcriptional regulatory protein, C terminal [Lutispora thermophila DSM 19022]